MENIFTRMKSKCHIIHPFLLSGRLPKVLIWGNERAEPNASITNSVDKTKM